MSSIACEQSLFCSEIRGKKRKDSKTSVTARVTCEWRAEKPRPASSAGGFAYHARTLMTHRSRELLSSLRSSPTDLRAKERLLVVHVLKQEVCL